MTKDNSTLNKAEVVSLKGQKCPICGQPVKYDFRPFCSRRCANLDLGNWLGEIYRLPTDEFSEVDDGIYDEELE